MLGELFAELFESLAPSPQTDRGLLIASIVAGGVGMAAPLVFPVLVADGVLAAQWITFLLAASSVTSAGALVVGVFYLFRRTAGAVLPITCTIFGLTGCCVAWL